MLGYLRNYFLIGIMWAEYYDQGTESHLRYYGLDAELLLEHYGLGDEPHLSHYASQSTKHEVFH